MRRELKPGMVIRRRLDFGPKPKVYFVLKAGSYQARLPGTDQTRLLEHAVDTWNTPLTHGLKVSMPRVSTSMTKSVLAAGKL